MTSPIKPQNHFPITDHSATYKIAGYINPKPITGKPQQAPDFASESIIKQVQHFHNTLPQYRPTPLVELTQLAQSLKLGSLSVKDESQRFDLNAFKVLGASYAMACQLSERLSTDHQPDLNISDTLSFEQIKEKLKAQKALTFVTATDGNHGRAVAWAAQKLGCKAVVYMPNGSSPARLNAIKHYGATAEITDKNYDDTVRHAKYMAEEKGWILMQDTAWQGYEVIPKQIMQGYFTLVSEAVEQSQHWPTHVFIQAGVGSLAAAIVSALNSLSDLTNTMTTPKKTPPKFIVVEPEGAPCLYQSMADNQGKYSSVSGDLNTIMAGLACGEPSTTAFEILRDEGFAFMKCDDDVARRGMRVLANPLNGDTAVISGESGAATMGVVYELMTREDLASLKERIGLNHQSHVWLFSTEGDTDPEAYREVVWS